MCLCTVQQKPREGEEQMERELGRSGGPWDLETNGGIPTPAMLPSPSHIHPLQGKSWPSGYNITTGESEIH